MGVKEKAGELVARFKAWVHSVPPDVWIGLAIGFVTLIVVWLAYKRSQSGSSSSSTDTGIINPADFGGSSGGSNAGTGDTGGALNGSPIFGQNPITAPSFPLQGSPIFGPGPINWPTFGAGGGGGGGAGKPPPIITGTPLMSVLNQNESNGQTATIKAQQAAAAAQAVYMGTLNQNEANGQQGTIAAVQQQQAVTMQYLQSIPLNTPDETKIAQSIYTPPPPMPLATSAPNQTETAIAKLIQVVQPKPAYKPAPVRTNPFAYTAPKTPAPTGRGTNIGF